MFEVWRDWILNILPTDVATDTEGNSPAIGTKVAHEGIHIRYAGTNRFRTKRCEGRSRYAFFPS